MTRKPLTPEAVQQRLETLCSKSEHCTHEILTKLKNWGISGSAAESIIESLVRDRFVDDSRFARSMVHYRVNQSGYGRRRISMELTMKRIPSDIIKEAIAEEIDEDAYNAKLHTLLQSKADRAEDLSSWESRNKLYRWALGRGFESEKIIAALKKILSGKRDDL